MGEIEALAVVQHTILHVYRIHSRNFLLFFCLVFFCFVCFNIREKLNRFISLGIAVNQSTIFSLLFLKASRQKWCCMGPFKSVDGVYIVTIVLYLSAICGIIVKNISSANKTFQTFKSIYRLKVKYLRLPLIHL